MSVNTGLALLSNHLMTVTVVIYSLALLAYAAELAYGRRRRVTAPVPASDVPAADRAKVLVGAGVPVEAPSDDAADGAARTGSAAGPAGKASGWRGANGIGRIAVVLTGIGLVAHFGEILTRGLAAHRVPWGNMYEFASAITFGAVLVYLVLLLRYRARFLGLFVMIPVVTGLGIATTELYVAAGPLMPALQSYWIVIHVTAAILATGTFVVAGATTVMYLLAERYERRVAAGLPVGFSGIARRLPGAQVLDRISYRTVIFGFPVWTFAIIVGAIWADQAWGRYWGWDPKETWSFITWVVYAGYLHARSTAGWRGRRAAFVQLVGFACLMFNFFGINMWVTGLHSYAGLSQ